METGSNSLLSGYFLRSYQPRSVDKPYMSLFYIYQTICFNALFYNKKYFYGPIIAIYLGSQEILDSTLLKLTITIRASVIIP